MKNTSDTLIANIEKGKNKLFTRQSIYCQWIKTIELEIIPSEFHFSIEDILKDGCYIYFFDIPFYIEEVYTSQYIYKLTTVCIKNKLLYKLDKERMDRVHSLEEILL